MASNFQKVPLGRSLNRVAQFRARDEAMVAQKGPPCEVVSVNNSIVTVKVLLNSSFTIPNLTIPIFGPEYIRYPIQPGCLGYAVPGDYYLGGVSGLGGGTADTSTRGNLTNLVFFPVGNRNFSATDDPDSLVLYGPDGVIIRDSGKNSLVNASQTAVVLSFGSVTVTINASGVVINGAGQPITLEGNTTIDGTLAVTGECTGAAGGTLNTGNINATGTIAASVDVTAAGISGKTHRHTGVTTGAGDTGTPI